MGVWNPSQVLLEPTQKDLLSRMVEGARNVPPEQREKFAYAGTHSGSLLHHPGLPEGNLPAYSGDLDILTANGLLGITPRPSGSALYDVTPQGYAYYAWLKQQTEEPLAAIEEEVRSYLGSASFRERYPLAHKRWSAAAELLWQSDSQNQLTTIGHLCREAVQEFATELVQQHQPPEPDSDMQHVVARVRAVLAHRKKRLGSAEEPFLDALVAYWGTVSDLIMRQEHGGQKEGEPLVWEDARRVVFQTGVVMFEVDRSLEKTR